jgi:hypothetical protein
MVVVAADTWDRLTLPAWLLASLLELLPILPRLSNPRRGKSCLLVEAELTHPPQEPTLVGTEAPRDAHMFDPGEDPHDSWTAGTISLKIGTSTKQSDSSSSKSEIVSALVIVGVVAVTVVLDVFKTRNLSCSSFSHKVREEWTIAFLNLSLTSSHFVGVSMKLFEEDADKLLDEFAWAHDMTP